ncbi:aldotetraouronic acid ABC transporter membrane protein 2 [Fontibacillus panacisegetis]|uniref:Aldotetraouronic acid ABC transporter membrane protein 2 n=1 Tax=Fontibacillus panacisegetis TaxID=670482 RepID=A0A1G7FVX0_9BACL|nr:carbohydrate ABC transporter permease [Fontibacillus panacisegetis]SDE80029.1 aldotetraouronic acid ABC transporter membrane protein 2 [Fontibacillus panacisegetis]
MKRIVAGQRRKWKLSAFDCVNVLLMLMLLVVTLYPFLNTLAVSFNQATDTVLGSNFIWPRKFTTLNYTNLFEDNTIYNAFFISVSRTVIGTITSLFCTAMLAYTISRKEYFLRRQISFLFIFTMYFSGGLIPGYMLIKNLHMNGTFWVYIIPGLIGAFNLIVMRSFMEGLPGSVVESAQIDGANHFTIFLKIVFPLSMPVLATVALFVAVGQWNSWFDTFLYNSSKQDLSTLQYELMKKLQSASMSVSGNAETLFSNSDNQQANIVTPTSIRAAITIVAAVPIIVIYPFLQRYFVHGLTLGGVKE